MFGEHRTAPWNVSGGASGHMTAKTLWKEDKPGFTVGWARRARLAKTAGMLAMALALGGMTVPVIVSACYDSAAEPPAVNISDAGLFGGEVFENPASFDKGYSAAARMISLEPARPVFVETFGPAYTPVFGPEFTPEESAGSMAMEAVEFSAAPAAHSMGDLAYPVASQVYDRLHSEGMGSVCIAGVLGNMMAECGGQTLALQPDCDSTDDGVRYYGLCQWSMRYNEAVDGRDVDGQLDYLMGNIESQMTYFGNDDGTYGNWLTSTDAAQAARDFNRYYERGAGSDQRAANAAVAYDWIAATYGV